MNWRVNLSLCVTGMIWGLTIAQFLVADELISYQIFCFVLALSTIDLAILIYVIHEGLRNV